MALAGAFFFGFVPMFLFAAFVNWLDRYEKEPKLLLGAAFVWGVVIAGGGAFILNTAFGIGRFWNNIYCCTDHRRGFERPGCFDSVSALSQGI